MEQKQISSLEKYILLFLLFTENVNTFFGDEEFNESINIFTETTDIKISIALTEITSVTNSIQNSKYITLNYDKEIQNFIKYIKHGPQNYEESYELNQAYIYACDILFELQSELVYSYLSNERINLLLKHIFNNNNNNLLDNRPQHMLEVLYLISKQISIIQQSVNIYEISNPKVKYHKPETHCNISNDVKTSIIDTLYLPNSPLIVMTFTHGLDCGNQRSNVVKFGSKKLNRQDEHNIHACHSNDLNYSDSLQILQNM